METDLERYTQIYPQLRATLVTLQGILTFQAEQAAKIAPGSLVAWSVAYDRWQAGLPLLDNESMTIPHLWIWDALAALRPWLPQDGQAQATLDRVLASGPVDATATDALLNSFGRNNKACLQQWAAEIAADFDTLVGLLHTVLTPFYQQQAVTYRPWIEKAGWRHGYCPLCGAEPSLARLERDSGRRSLLCSLCRSEWIFDRLRCPFCEAASAAQMRHFTVEGDPVHRVDCCAQCRRYLKIIDERLLDYPANILAEEIVTAQLDTLAREQGYH